MNDHGIDIFYLHKKVIDCVKDFKNNVDMINKEIKYISKIKIHDAILSKDINIKLKYLETTKEDYENKIKNFNFYLLDFKHIGEAYTKELHVCKKISFVNKNVNKKQDDNLKKIYNDFYDLIKKYDFYINDDISDKKFKKKYDDIDDTPISVRYCVCGSKNFVFDSTIQICENCGIENEVFEINKDGSKPLNNKYIYERKAHFRECINQYQGKQNTFIKKEIYEQIENQLSSYGLLNNSEVRSEKFFRVTKEHVFLVMKELKLTKYYEDHILIFHNLTGKKVDNISDIENLILDDFDLFVKEYDKKYSSISRKSFINTRILLFQLLKKNKYPCKPEDFRILKTLERLSLQDEMVKTTFENLNWCYHVLF